MRLFTDLRVAMGCETGPMEMGLTRAFGRPIRAWMRLGVTVCLGAAILSMLCPWTMLAQEGRRPEAKLLRDVPASKDGKSAGQEKPRTRYYLQVVEQVKQKWHVYLGEQENVPPGEVQVVFYVNARGGVENVRVVNEKPAPPLLTDLTLRAVRNADIAAIPADVVPTLPVEDGGRLKIFCGIRNPGKTPETERGEVAKADEMQKPIPKALPVADDEPKAAPLTQMMNEADRALAEGDKNRRPKMEHTPLGRYYRLVIGQVEKRWHAYVRLNKKGIKLGALKVVFHVNKMGRVEGVKVADDKESYPLLTRLTLLSIKEAEIPPMSEDVIPLLPQEDQGRLKIEYNVLIY